MTLGAGLFSLMSMLVSGEDRWPQTLVLVEKTFICKEVTSYFSKEGYPYAGLTINKKDYLTEYKSADALQTEVDKQCKK